MADRDMTLIEHLAELRSRLIKAFAGFIAAMAVTWFFHEQIYRFLLKPVIRGLAPYGVGAPQALDVMEGISVYLKASMAAAFVISAPWIIWQAAAFAAPALHRRERRTFAFGTALVAMFFALGVIFSYSIFVPMVVEFLAGFGVGSGDLRLAPTVQNTFGVSMFFMIVFGFIFELPLVMMFAGILHLAGPKVFLKYWRHFVVAAFIVAAIFTPPEPVSQTLMAIPLCLLYGLGILMAWAGWHAGGGNPRGRAVAAAASAVVIFAGGVIAAALLWDDTSGAADAKPAGHRQALLELDHACAERVSGWKIAPSERLIVSFGPDGASGVVFQASGDTVLTIPAAQGRTAIDRFIWAGRERAWTAVRDGRSTIMVSASPPESEAFLSALVAATGALCR